MLHAIKLVVGRVGVLSRRVVRKACVVGSPSILMFTMREGEGEWGSMYSLSIRYLIVVFIKPVICGNWSPEIGLYIVVTVASRSLALSYTAYPLSINTYTQCIYRAGKRGEKEEKEEKNCSRKKDTGKESQLEKY